MIVRYHVDRSISGENSETIIVNFGDNEWMRHSPMKHVPKLNLHGGIVTEEVLDGVFGKYVLDNGNFARIGSSSTAQIQLLKAYREVRLLVEGEAKDGYYEVLRPESV